MTTLVEFIEARLMEDENHAKKDLHMLDRASNGGAWEYGVGYNLPYSELGEGGSIGRLTASYGRALADGEPDQHNADVMLVARMVRSARRRAERVLREVEAKRRILVEVVELIDGMEAQIKSEWGSHSDPPEPPEHLPLLRLLAAPYAYHPAYRPEWSPSSVTPPE